MTTFKVLIKIVLTAAMAYLLQNVFPWWSAVIASFLISLVISTKGFSSFIGGFLGIAILWFCLAFLIDLNSDSLLTERVAAIFSLQSTILLVLVTSVVGGVAGGLGALSGSHLRSWLLPSRWD